MARPLPSEDNTPWYRQFWPWFLILLPASVVVAGLTTVVIANRGADDLVVDEYYKDGLAINRKLEKIQLADELGITADLTISGSNVAVAVSRPIQDARLLLLLSHPLESDRDFGVELTRVAPQHYQGKLPRAVSARWHWTLESPQADGWRLDGSIETADFSHATGR